jgi:uncharacterized protein YkwD
MDRRGHRARREHRGFVRALVWLGALGAGACAGTDAQTKVQSVMSGDPGRRFTPSGKGADVYSTRAESALPGDALTKQIEAQIVAGRKQRGFAAVARDGRLDRVAFDVAAVERDCRAPSPELAAALLWHYGVPEPEPSLFMHCGDDGAEPAALANMRAQFSVAGAQPEWRRVGIGVARSAGHWAAVVVFQEKNLELDPVPRRLSVGGHEALAARLQAPYHEPEVLITPPRGAVVRPLISTRRDGFSAPVDCNLGEGVYQVELLGHDRRGPRVLANFPVYCATEPPTRFVFTTPAAAMATDPAVLERQLLDLVDRDRARAGLPAFVHDPRLHAVARRYSQEMAETGVVAHISSRTGSVLDRLRAAGLAPPPTVVAENVAAATSVEDAEQGFMGSPGHRDNVLSPAVTHIGVGVAVGHAADGTAGLYFTQIFVGWGK